MSNPRNPLGRTTYPATGPVYTMVAVWREGGMSGVYENLVAFAKRDGKTVEAVVNTIVDNFLKSRRDIPKSAFSGYGLPGGPKATKKPPTR